MNKNYEYKKLCPFKWFVLQNFPFLDYDFDQITNWQLFQKLGEKINDVIKSQNLVGQEMEELVSAFNSLTDYVDNYFENLDVQDEINNKLDEMAESGELAEIIAQYLQLQGLLCYNTKNDLKNAENLANGSFAKTYGSTSYNDGEGYFYKIRTILNTDIIDDDNIIALVNYPNLIAEKIKNTIETPNPLNNRKFIFIGDSYNTTDTPSGGTQITPWGTLVAKYLGLSETDYFNSGVSGAGWTVTNNKFITQLENLYNSITDKNSITDIIVLGGINDNPYESTDVYDEIVDFSEYVSENYPNAIITIGIISWSTYDASKLNLVKKFPYYNASASLSNVRVIANSHNWYHNYTQYQSDGHPNYSGSISIAYHLANYIKNGITEIQNFYQGSIYRDGNNLGITNPTIGSIKHYLIDNFVSLLIDFDLISLENNSITCSINTPYILGSIDSPFIKNDQRIVLYQGHCWGYDTSSSKYVNFVYTLYLDGINLKISFDSVDPNIGTQNYTLSVLSFTKIPVINIPTVLS